MNSNDYERWKDNMISYFIKLTDHQQIQLVSSLIDKGKMGLKWHLSQSLDKLLKRDFITNLPSELSHFILNYLDYTTLLNCCQVNQSWNFIISSCRQVWWKLCINIGAFVNETMEGLDCKESFLHAQKILCRLSKGKAFTEQKISGHAEKVIALVYRDNLLATGSEGRTVNVWDFKDGQLSQGTQNNNLPLFTINVSNSISCLSLDHALLVVGHFMGNCTVWDLVTCQIRYVLIGHVGAILCVDFNTEKEILVTGSTDKTVKVWTLKNGTLLYSLTLAEEFWVSSVSLIFDMVSKNIFDVVFRGKHIIERCQFEISDEMKIFQVTSTQKDMRDTNTGIPTESNFTCMKHVIKGIKIDKCPFKDDVGNEIIHQAVLNDTKFYILASGKYFSIILLATWTPLMCIIKSQTKELVGSFRFHRRPFTPRVETLIDLGDNQWLDGISKSNTKGLMMAATCNDANILCLHWKL